MAAGNWTVYKKAKKYLANATINLGSDVFRMQLMTSASNFATSNLSTRGSLTSEVASGNGYTRGGKTLTSVTWSTGVSAGQYKFNAANISWKASGGTIPSVRVAVIIDNTTGASLNARKLLAYVTLSTAHFTVSSGNTLQINTPATGLFTLA